MKLNLFGLKIYVSYPFAAMLTLSLIFDKTGAAAGSFFAALLHELGHITAMRISGSPAIEVNLTPFDFRITDKASGMRSFNEEIFISFAGCAVNFTLFLISSFIYSFLCYNCISVFAGANLFIGLFNILPVESLDGGRIVFLLLAKRFDENVCLRLVTAASVAVIIPIAILGFFILLKSGYNYSLLLISIYLILLLLLKKRKG